MWASFRNGHLSSAPQHKPTVCSGFFPTLCCFNEPKTCPGTLLGETLWSNVVCIEDQSPSASAMVMNSVCTCLPVQLSVVRRASCVSPASTEITRVTHVQLHTMDHEKPLAAAHTGGFSKTRQVLWLINVAIKQKSQC